MVLNFFDIHLKIYVLTTTAVEQQSGMFLHLWAKFLCMFSILQAEQDFFKGVEEVDWQFILIIAY